MMKMMTLLGAAALMGLGTIAPAAASAEQTVVRTHTTTTTYHNSRPRWGTRRVCTTKWRNHRKVRVCRTVRYRRY